MKISKFLTLILFTAIFSVSTITSATAAIPTNNVTLNGSGKIAFDQVKDGTDVIGQPIREMADPYFDNIWYASLYPNVKQYIDNNYFGGNRINQYIRICRTIADNKGLTFSSAIWHPSGDVGEYLYNRIVLVVKEENGTINCYQRVPQFPN